MTNFFKYVSGYKVNTEIFSSSCIPVLSLSFFRYFAGQCCGEIKYIDYFCQSFYSFKIMNHSVRSLLPSLLLIGIYFIADEFFGTVTGVWVAFLLGGAEFIYTRIREKVYDKMILLTTLFFCIPGLISIWANGSVLSQLQPAIIETALCLLLGFFAFSHTDFTHTLPAGYRKNIHLSGPQLQSMRKMLRILFILVALHTLLAYTAILFLPEDTAKFITTPLLYIILGTYFVVFFIYNRLLLRKMKKEEWLPIVDEKGEVTGQAPRSICHSGSKLLHPVVHLHITNDRHELFLQKRSMKKDLLPGMWDTAVGGHIGVNEKVEDALKREASEELGITDFEARFLGNYVWESPRERELVFSFLCTRYNHIHIDNDEVDEGRFWTLQELAEGMEKNKLTPNLVHEYRLLLKPLFNRS